MEKKVIAEYPKVSIITCIYNGEKYISKLLDSVLNMGYPNIEHIIVNDGSTDGTEDIVMKYAELYKNKGDSNLYIKYTKQDNMGLGGATNTGLKEITGEYWTWINCDDWYEPKAFFEPIELLIRKPKLNYVQMNGYYYQNSTKEIIVKNNNSLKFKSKRKLYQQYCNKHKDRKWLLYICRTSDYKSICNPMQIYPYKYTQDEQFIYQIFGVLNGDICTTPKWNFLIRDDSFYKQHSIEMISDYDLIKTNSIKMLSIKKSTKRSLYALIYENRYIDKVKELALNGNPKGVIQYVNQCKIYRNHLDIRYFIYFNHMLPLYFAYSLLMYVKHKIFK